MYNTTNIGGLFMERKYIDTFGIRHSYIQKTKFLKAMQKDVEALGYETYIHTKRMRLTRIRHLFVGNIKNAKKLVIVPYDTPTQVFWPNYKYYPIDGDMYIRKHFLPVFAPMVVAYAILLGMVYILPSLFPESMKTVLFYISVFYLFFLLAFIVFGFANKNNVNRNSASVCLAYEALQTLDAKKRRENAFVFVDSSILKGYGGKVLSAYLEEVHKNPIKLCLNCIGMGEEVCVGFSKGMRKEAQTLCKAYKGKKSIQTKSMNDSHKFNTPIDSLNDAMILSCGSFEEENFVVYNTASKKDVYVEEEHYKTMLEMLLTYLQM